MVFVWDTGKRFWQSTCNALIHHRSLIKEFFTLRIKVPQVETQCRGVQGDLSRKVKKAIDHEFFLSMGNLTEFSWHSSFILINSPTPSTFSCWNIRFKTQVNSCSGFPSETILLIKEVEMVDSVDELKSSRSIEGKDFPNFELLGRENCLCFEQYHSEFLLQEEGQSRGTEGSERGSVSTRKTDRLHDLRLLSSHWYS